MFRFHEGLRDVDGAAVGPSGYVECRWIRREYFKEGGGWHQGVVADKKSSVIVIDLEMEPLFLIKRAGLSEERGLTMRLEANAKKSGVVDEEFFEAQRCDFIQGEFQSACFEGMKRLGLREF